MRHFFVIIFFLLPVANSALAEPKPISKLEVGILTSLSDEWASEGNNIVRGAQLAAEELNQAGGVEGLHLALVPEDTQEANSGAKAVSAYRKLRLQGLSFFIGPAGTPAAMALAPIIAKDPVIVITPLVGVREFSSTAKNIFNSRGVDEASSRLMARYAFEQGWKRSSVLSSQQAWENAQGKAFRDEFEKLGGKVVAFQEPLPDASDLKTPVTRILAPKPDVVFMSNANRMPIAARELSNLGYRGPRLTTMLDNSMVEQAQGTLEGAIFADFGGPSAEFRKKFEGRFGAPPGLGANTSYDAVMALASAIRQAHSLVPSEVLRALTTVSVPGSAGTFSFDINRLAQRQLVKFRVLKSDFKQFS